MRDWSERQWRGIIAAVSVAVGLIAVFEFPLIALVALVVLAICVIPEVLAGDI